MPLIRNHKIIDLAIIFLIAIIPFTIYYKFPVIFSQLSTFLLMVLFALIVVKALSQKNENYFITKTILSISLPIFLIWILLVSFLSFINYGSFNHLNSLISAIIILTILLLLKKAFIDPKLVLKIYTFFAVVAIVGYLIEIVYYFSTKNILILKLPFQISEGYSFSFSYDTRYNNGFVQFSSFFSEKAHFCEYLLPLLGVCLFDKAIKKSTFKALLLSALILSTSSGIGIVCVLFLWCLKVIWLLVTKKETHKYLAFILLAIFVMLIVHLILYNYFPSYQLNFDKLFSASGQSSKADYRVYRGFDIFNKMPFVEKIFGIGYRQYEPFSLNYYITSIYDGADTNSEYFSAITQILIYFGIIGFLVCFCCIFNLWKKSVIISRAILLVFLLECFAASILFDSIFLLYFSLITFFKKGIFVDEEQYQEQIA